MHSLVFGTFHTSELYGVAERLMKQYQDQKHLFSVTVSKVDQKILELFLQEGYYQRHLNKMRGIYKGKHDFLLKYLREEMSQSAKYLENMQGYIFCLTFCKRM